MSEKKLLNTAAQTIFKPVEMNCGIDRFKSLKFFLVLILYLAAMIIFANDPFFADKRGNFSYNQSVLILFTSVIIMISLHWDVLLFGKPAGANLCLQLTSILPFMLFYGRIMGVSNVDQQKSSWLGKAMKWAADGVKTLSGFEFPQWISDLFSHWQCTFVLIFVLAVLCFRNSKVRISGVVIILLIPFLTVLSTSAERLYLVIGFVLMFAGLAMQYNNYASNVYYLNILNRLKERKSVDDILVRTVMRIMKKLNENNRIQENEVFEIVKSEYVSQNDLSQSDVRIISGELMKSMMNEFNLITMKLTHNGIVAMPDYKLYNCDNILSHIAIFPRVAVVLFLTVIFLLSPVDIIPDSLPLIGVLDDMALTVISFFATKNSLEVHREK